jgi:thiosulfate dehydrogenase [quinone] large subunit
MAKTIAMDDRSGVQLTPMGATTAALFRIGMGLLYLWAFVTAAFGVGYQNADPPGSATNYGWHFTYDSSMGWITSGFKHSPTAGFVSILHGPLAFIPQKLPTGVDDFFWVFAIAGLGFALTLGILMRIAGWGGFALNILLWFCLFPPDNNPILDGEHMAFAFGILLLMFVHAGNWWGFGRPWSRHTPAWLN